MENLRSLKKRASNLRHNIRKVKKAIKAKQLVLQLADELASIENTALKMGVRPYG